jgi:Rod binding domain-containing protein
MEISQPSSALIAPGPAMDRNQEAIRTENDRGDALQKACAEMEALFIFHLLQEMRATVPKEGLLHGGMGEEIFTSLMDGEMARTIALERGLGLAQLMESQLSGKFNLEPVPAAPPPRLQIKI